MVKLVQIGDVHQRVEKKLRQVVKRVILRRILPKISKAAHTFLNETYNLSNQKIGLIDGTSVAESGGVLNVDRLERFMRKYEQIRGHTCYAIVPQFRLKQAYSSSNRRLQDMQKSGTVVITPGKTLNNQILTSNPNPIILDIASAFNSEIVSNHNFQSELHLNQDFESIVKSQLIRFEWDGNGDIRFFSN